MTSTKRTAKKYKLGSERNGMLYEFQRLQVEKEQSSNGFAKCITCGCITDKAQGGHYITRTCRATEDEEDNVNPQCPVCNVLKSGDLVNYRIKLIEKIGLERVERLEDMMLASRGDESALDRLSETDRAKVRMKKSASFYHDKKLQYRRERKELKERRGY